LPEIPRLVIDIKRLAIAAKFVAQEAYPRKARTSGIDIRRRSAPIQRIVGYPDFSDRVDSSQRLRP
jgi:hypothetical protein